MRSGLIFPTFLLLYCSLSLSVQKRRCFSLWIFFHPSTRDERYFGYLQGIFQSKKINSLTSGRPASLSLCPPAWQHNEVALDEERASSIENARKKWRTIMLCFCESPPQSRGSMFAGVLVCEPDVSDAILCPSSKSSERRRMKTIGQQLPPLIKHSSRLLILLRKAQKAEEHEASRERKTKNKK